MAACHQRKTPATADRIVAIRRVAATPNQASGVEIEVTSARAFPARNEIVVLRIGAKESLLSRYPAGGDLHTLIFTMTSEDFAQTSPGDRVEVHYGRAEGSLDRWEFGPRGP